MTNKESNKNKKDRVVYLLRKSLNLSQESFGQKIGVSKSAISRMESGDYDITDTMSKVICSTFNVNEEWLKTGKGDMFLTLDSSEEFAKAVNKIFNDEDPIIKNMIIEMARLSDEEKDNIKKTLEIIKKITSIL